MLDYYRRRRFRDESDTFDDDVMVTILWWRKIRLGQSPILLEFAKPYISNGLASNISQTTSIYLHNPCTVHRPKLRLNEGQTLSKTCLDIVGPRPVPCASKPLPLSPTLLPIFSLIRSSSRSHSSLHLCIQDSPTYCRRRSFFSLPTLCTALCTSFAVVDYSSSDRAIVPNSQEIADGSSAASVLATVAATVTCPEDSECASGVEPANIRRMRIVAFTGGVSGSERVNGPIMIALEMVARTWS